MLSFPPKYDKLFENLGTEKAFKIGLKCPEAVDEMAKSNELDVLTKWYKATGGRWLPHQAVMRNFPENEIDSFLKNSKKWSRLMQNQEYSYSEDAKTAILKIAYSLGIFHGNNENFTALMKILGNNYIDGINLTPEIAHQIFDSFEMKYDPKFAKFFLENFEAIMKDSDSYKDIANIQRNFEKIRIVNSGRKLTLDLAKDFIKNIAYDDIDDGNLELAEQAKIAGYTEEAFSEVQKLYNKGKLRSFSSIPRITGKTDKGYSYEILKCDDPLAITIGTLTDCCQEIYGAGQTSMEHSVLSRDGRVFVVRDAEGKIVAQSWFWRNSYVGCFDNIEIPNRIFSDYERNNPTQGRSRLTNDVLEVYKQASKDLMRVDKETFDELLQAKIISQEQYDSLLLGKITTGLGYNDIADAIQGDEGLKRNENNRYAPMYSKGEKLIDPYTDARIQYVLDEREGVVDSDLEFDSLYIYQDDINVYDSTNMTEKELNNMKSISSFSRSFALQQVNSYGDEEKTESERIIESISRVYYIENSGIKVLSTKSMAMIVQQNGTNLSIVDMVNIPIDDLDENNENVKAHIINEYAKALSQLLSDDTQIDISQLREDQLELYNMAKVKADKIRRIHKKAEENLENKQGEEAETIDNLDTDDNGER